MQSGNGRQIRLNGPFPVSKPRWLDRNVRRRGGERKGGYAKQVGEFEELPAACKADPDSCSPLKELLASEVNDGRRPCGLKLDCPGNGRIKIPEALPSGRGEPDGLEGGCLGCGPSYQRQCFFRKSFHHEFKKKHKNYRCGVLPRSVVGWHSADVRVANGSARTGFRQARNRLTSRL